MCIRDSTSIEPFAELAARKENVGGGDCFPIALGSALNDLKPQAKPLSAEDVAVGGRIPGIVRCLVSKEIAKNPKTYNLEMGADLITSLATSKTMFNSIGVLAAALATKTEILIWARASDGHWMLHGPPPQFAKRLKQQV
eukprot:983710-Pyramimonas_sp.AAC.1